METRTLGTTPAILPLYARAAAPLIPGASLLPFVPGRGTDVPDLELSLPEVRPEPEAVAAYAKVCGFTLRDALPPTYPHVLAFPLHMAVMADGDFPFGAVGLVHVENRIVQHRPIGIGEELKLTVRPTKLQPHPRGRTFGLVTEVWIDGEKAWESSSTMLRRDPSASGEKRDDREPTPRVFHEMDGKRGDDERRGPASEDRGERLTPSAEWRLGGDLGRRYGAVSGDRNPIHMHSLAAKPLGFPSAIAHGVWTKARCLAALESRLPDAFAADVRFRKPIRLPGKIEFLCDADGEEIHFAVRDAKRHTPHLDGVVEPVDPKGKSAAESKTTASNTSGRKSK